MDLMPSLKKKGNTGPVWLPEPNTIGTDRIKPRFGTKGLNIITEKKGSGYVIQQETEKIFSALQRKQIYGKFDITTRLRTGGRKSRCVFSTCQGQKKEEA